MKFLIVLRHADRTALKLESSEEALLTARGHSQAAEIAKLFYKKFEKIFSKGSLGQDSELFLEAAKRDLLLLSSPRTRCIQTLQPLSDALGCKIRISKMVADHGLGEKSYTFQKRLERFLQFWQQKAPQWTVVCSHADWIPGFSSSIGLGQLNLEKAAWRVFKYDEKASESSNVLSYYSTNFEN